MITLKKRHWLDLAEYASVVGLGVGSIAAFFSTLSAQVLLTSAPLSFLVLLNLANRKRMEQQGEQKTAVALAEVKHKMTRHLVHLHEQVQALPTVETVSSLRRSLLTRDREVLEKLTGDLQELRHELDLRMEPIEQQNFRSIRPEVRQLREQYAHLYDSVAHISYQLQQLTASSKVEDLESAIAHLKRDLSQVQTQLQDLNSQTKPSIVSLQDQITHVHRQFQKLPPPVDASSLKQEVAELVKIVAELVPRREVVTLLSEVKQLHQQQESLQQSIAAIESAAINFKRQLSKLPQAPSGGIALGNDAPHQAYLQAWFDSGLSSAAIGQTNVYPEVQDIVAAYLGQLRSQLTDVQQMTQTLAQHQRQLRAYVNQLPQTLDVVALQRQLQRLTDSITSSQSTRSLQSRIRETLHREFRGVNQQLQSLPAAPQYELIFDLDGGANSRAVLEEALEQTQQRLILVFPWSSDPAGVAAQYRLDAALIQKMESFLKDNGRLEVGWCHQAVPAERFLSPIERGWIDPQSPVLQETLNQLLRLKRTYGDRFHFKIFGTSENFLVSDQTFAVMGVHDTLTTHTVLAELRLKLRTTDRSVIQQLIHRFDNSTLDLDDIAAHWNRAVTRYELGDKAGAIEDYTHLLSRQPDAAAYNHRGLARYDQGDLLGAIADFDRSIALDSRQVAAYCNRGFLQAEAGDLLWAITDYTLAIENQPNAAIAYHYRGLIYQRLEDFNSAEIDFSEAIRLAPDAAVVRYYRGITCQKLGDYAASIDDLEMAAKSFGDRGNKANAQKALRALRRSLRETVPTQPSGEAIGYPMIEARSEFCDRCG